MLKPSEGLYWGRNRRGELRGVDVHVAENLPRVGSAGYVSIRPITSKGEPTDSCRMDMPVDIARQLVADLTDAVARLEASPTTATLKGSP